MMLDINVATELLKRRFLVFGTNAYYPGGGFADLVGAFSTLEEAEAFVKSQNYYESYDINDILDIELEDTNP